MAQHASIDAARRSSRGRAGLAPRTPPHTPPPSARNARSRASRCGRAPPSSASAWRPRRRSCSTQPRARTRSSSTQQLTDLKRAAVRERYVTSVLATAVGALATVERDCGADTRATYATREKHAAARREIESLRKEHETLAMQHVLGAHARQLTRARQRRRRRGARARGARDLCERVFRRHRQRHARGARADVRIHRCAGCSYR